jgi:hypothetical protein
MVCMPASHFAAQADRCACGNVTIATQTVVVNVAWLNCPREALLAPISRRAMWSHARKGFHDTIRHNRALAWEVPARIIFVSCFRA